MASLIGVTVLGSTGTIGENTLDVIGRHRDRCRVVALGANVNDRRMAEQCAKWRPEVAVMADSGAAGRLRERLRGEGIDDVEVRSGVEALARIAARHDVDTVMAAIVGAAGLAPTMTAVRAGKRILLASKEVLVMSGRLFMDATRRHRAELLPIDSEHNAIFQCMPAGFLPGYPPGASPRTDGPAENHPPSLDPRAGGHPRDAPRAVPGGVQRILLTASGGPFRNLPAEAFDTITPEQACAHPNWVMGKKISVDSATMMNKGLELIEACWLFDTTPDRIQVIVHPQSVIHSMVEYDDGSVLAQMGNPDMRTPIAHALFWPDRVASGVRPLDITAIGRLDFEPADPLRFPCLRLGYEAVRAGGTAPAIMNAANEVAVAAFLARRIGFGDIYRIIDATLSRRACRAADTLETVLEDDAAARRIADGLVGGHAPNG